MVCARVPIYCVCVLSFAVLSFEMRSRFEEDPAFQAITEDAERARLFKEYCKALKVGWEEVAVHAYMAVTIPLFIVVCCVGESKVLVMKYSLQFYI